MAIYTITDNNGFDDEQPIRLDTTEHNAETAADRITVAMGLETEGSLPGDLLAAIDDLAAALLRHEIPADLTTYLDIEVREVSI